jgi:hypothetical protein
MIEYGIAVTYYMNGINNLTFNDIFIYLYNI